MLVAAGTGPTAERATEPGSLLLAFAAWSGGRTSREGNDLARTPGASAKRRLGTGVVSIGADSAAALLGLLKLPQSSRLVPVANDRSAGS